MSNWSHCWVFFFKLSRLHESPVNKATNIQSSLWSGSILTEPASPSKCLWLGWRLSPRSCIWKWQAPFCKDRCSAFVHVALQSLWSIPTVTVNASSRTGWVGELLSPSPFAWHLATSSSFWGSKSVNSSVLLDLPSAPQAFMIFAKHSWQEAMGKQCEQATWQEPTKQCQTRKELDRGRLEIVV